MGASTPRRGARVTLRGSHQGKGSSTHRCDRKIDVTLERRARSASRARCSVFRADASVIPRSRDIGDPVPHRRRADDEKSFPGAQDSLHHEPAEEDARGAVILVVAVAGRCVGRFEEVGEGVRPGVEVRWRGARTTRRRCLSYHRHIKPGRLRRCAGVRRGRSMWGLAAPMAKRQWRLLDAPHPGQLKGGRSLRALHDAQRPLLPGRSETTFAQRAGAGASV